MAACFLRNMIRPQFLLASKDTAASIRRVCLDRLEATGISNQTPKCRLVGGGGATDSEKCLTAPRQNGVRAAKPCRIGIHPRRK
jgi:hypothetical protein